ncbi:putative membrane protein [Anaerovirgula multivorans]|uniref:Putative membrane protein n=1 Tax=Anaerovirgula multivorans TaxID=312168 RepID=A0A239L9F1_9FIRM|nr:DUF1980 domain-containing protein [Anaerovirgula multivorans]SNT26134.1 putative membrane protein [Anaerovirgula multivorans]
MRKTLDINESIKFIILLGYTYYIYHLLAFNTILYFMEPRLVKFAIPLLIALILLSIFQAKKVVSHTKKGKIKFGYLAFFIPLIIAVTTVPWEINEALAIKIGGSIEDRQVIEEIYLNEDAIEGIDYRRNGVLEIDEKVFDDALTKIKQNPELYVGQRVSIAGFIDIKDSFSENTFAICRLLMVCCEDDALITGILAEWENIYEFDNYDWVQLKGFIDRIEHHDEYGNKTHISTVIKVEEIKKIERPSSIYVYPASYEE